LQEKQARYARLIVRTAVNLQAGQPLFIWRAPVEASEFIRMLAEEAYGAGARQVEIFWEDDRIRLARFLHGQEAPAGCRPAWEAKVLAEGAAGGSAFLLFDCTCAGLLDPLRPDRLARLVIEEGKRLDPLWQYLASNDTNWTMVTVPTESWARKLYAGLAVEEGIARIWEDIFTYCRLQGESAEEAWVEHIAALRARSDYLTLRGYRELRFRGPGTDLSIGLPERHLWLGAGFVSRRGVPFIPNLPMEEVFTLPHRGVAEGAVRGTLPLVVNGGIVEEFSLTFRQGRVVSFAAKRGQRLLEAVLATDEGASRLGEVALVSQSSPIAESGRLFYNTLFDENASCHLALGRSYRFSLREGSRFSAEEFAMAGGNLSLLHVDFMIGSSALEAEGIDSEGRSETLLRGGEWAFTVDRAAQGREDGGGKRIR